MDKVLGKVLYKGLSKQGLYPIPFELPTLLKHASTTASTSTAQSQSASTSTAQSQYGPVFGYHGKLTAHSLWHKRFGHPSSEIVNSMLTKCKLSSSLSSKTLVCEPCLLGKFRKLPFSESSTKSVAPFELVHSDVWGPSPHLSLDGYRYYVLFIDDCTRYTWIFPMKNKTEVFAYFKSLCSFVLTQFNCFIKCLRSDGGGEYVNHRFHEFLTEK